MRVGFIDKAFRLFYKIFVWLRELSLLQLCVGTWISVFAGGISFVVIVLASVFIGRKKWIWLLVGIVIGAWRINAWQVESQWEFDNGYELVVDQPPVMREVSQSIIGHVRAAPQVRLYVTLQRYPAWKVGDVLSVASQPELIDVSTGFGEYLRSIAVGYSDQNPKSVVWMGREYNLVTVFADIRESLVGKLNSMLSPQSADLVAGILLGIKAEFDPQFSDDLKVAGLSHIVAVSGYNVTVVVNACLVLVIVLGRRWVTWLSIIAVISFWLLVGTYNLPATRAVILSIITLVATLLGKKSNWILALVYASTLMLLENPAVFGNVSWQLSIAAYLGISIFGQSDTECSNLLYKSVKPALWITLLTSPLLFLHFQEVSFAGIITNMFILPLVPVLMAVGGTALSLQVLTGGIKIAFPIWLTNWLGGLLGSVLQGLMPVLEIFVVKDMANLTLGLVCCLLALAILKLSYENPGAKCQSRR